MFPQYITITLSTREFFAVLDAVADLVDECEQMADCGDEWPYRLKISSRLLKRLKTIEQLEVTPN